MGHKSHDPCYLVFLVEAGFMTFVIHCTDFYYVGAYPESLVISVTWGRGFLVWFVAIITKMIVRFVFQNGYFRVPSEYSRRWSWNQPDSSRHCTYTQLFRLDFPLWCPTLL